MAYNKNDLDAQFKEYLDAIAWAQKYHIGQTYGDNHSYGYHLFQVAHQVNKWAYIVGFDDETLHNALVASWLHDILEDTDVTFEQITEHFGQAIADIVDRVTNPNFLDGKKLARKEKHAISYPRIAENHIAIFIKLCDRIANVTYSKLTKSNMVGMYRKEHQTFRNILKVSSPNAFDPMWDYLDNLLDYKGT